MILVLKPNTSDAAVDAVIQNIEKDGFQAHLSKGSEVTIIGIIGDKSKFHTAAYEINPCVEKIVPISESYKLTNIKFHPEPTSFQAGNTQIGPGTLSIMAGPCAIESETQLLTIAAAVKKEGATILRGGAYKPRTSPYSFQGLEEEGLRYMKKAQEETGLATICEVTSSRSLDAAVKYVDMIQIGARNMQNFELLKEVGKCGLPVMLKRGLSSTIDEWLNAAEYIISEGNERVTLCERGIRTFETATRNTLDLSAVVVLKNKTHLPVIVDPSHATGVRDYVLPLSKAAVACGADGLMVEVHNNPACALSDGAQSLNLEQFHQFMEELKPYRTLSGRTSA